MNREEVLNIVIKNIKLNVDGLEETEIDPKKSMAEYGTSSLDIVESDRDLGFHIEGFYTHRLTDNINITPGVFWLTAPNHDARNPDVVVGVLRTTFSF